MPAVRARVEMLGGLNRKQTPPGHVLFFAVVFKFSSSLAKHKPETVLKLKILYKFNRKFSH